MMIEPDKASTESEAESEMKKYFVHYYRCFGNTYNLFWTDSPEKEKALPEGAERITRSKALEMAREESYRRKVDQMFSGFASTTIMPIGYSDLELYNNRQYQLVGRIWERRKGNGND